MSIELPKEAYQEAVASLQRYARENIEADMGNIAVAGLLDFFLEEIAPLVYNRAVADAQERLQMRVGAGHRNPRGSVSVLAQAATARQAAPLNNLQK